MNFARWRASAGSVFESVVQEIIVIGGRGLVGHCSLPDEHPLLNAQEQVVLDSEVVNFNLTATDDFGVKEMGLEWVGSLTQADGKTPINGSKVVSAGGPEKKEVTTTGTFCATREDVAPQTLEVRAWVNDYLPGRHPIHSAVFILHVLNKTDHAISGAFTIKHKPMTDGAAYTLTSASATPAANGNVTVADGKFNYTLPAYSVSTLALGAP